MDKLKRYNDRYKDATKFQEVDAFIKTESSLLHETTECFDALDRPRSLSHEAKERIRLALQQEKIFEELQIEHTELETQLQQRKRSTSLSPSLSPSTSKQSSPILRPLTSILSKPSSTHTSPILRPILSSTHAQMNAHTAYTAHTAHTYTQCPVCNLLGESETILMWKECGHTSIPVLSLTEKAGVKLPKI
jgi:hypothetical protein